MLWCEQLLGSPQRPTLCYPSLCFVSSSGLLALRTGMSDSLVCDTIRQYLIEISFGLSDFAERPSIAAPDQSRRALILRGNIASYRVRRLKTAESISYLCLLQSLCLYSLVLLAPSRLCCFSVTPSILPPGSKVGRFTSLGAGLTVIFLGRHYGRNVSYVGVEI